MFGFNKSEMEVIRKLNTPRKIQDFLDKKLKINFELKGETCMSPRMVLKTKKAHCIEGAMLAAAILRVHGHDPLILDLTAVKHDEDHVIALFKQHGMWGAISKTNHSVLRYREPVYASIRELVMSCFHEYFDPKGKKTLRSYSIPVNMKIFDEKGWMTAFDNLWYVNDYLEKVDHKNILSRAQIATLRKADWPELDATDIVQYKKPARSFKVSKSFKISGKKK